MTTEQKIHKFMEEFNTTYMIASDWLFANNDDYEKACNDYLSWFTSLSE